MTADVPVFEATLKNCQTFSTLINDSAFNDDPFGPKFQDIFSEQEIEFWRQWCVPNHDLYIGGHVNGLRWNYSMIQQQIGEFMNAATPAHKCSRNNTDDEVGEGRIFISMTKYYEEQHIGEMYGLWCEPVYSLSRRTVTNVSDASRESYQIHVSPDVKEDLRLGVIPDSITSYILYSLEDLSSKNPTVQSALWKILLNHSEPQSDPMGFRDASLMENLSKRVWNQFSAFAVENGCKSPVSERQTILGTATSTKGRLCIQALSLRLMESLLGLLMLFSISLTFCVSPPLHRELLMPWR